jgi:hypothetical protein
MPPKRFPPRHSSKRGERSVPRSPSFTPHHPASKNHSHRKQTGRINKPYQISYPYYRHDGAFEIERHGGDMSVGYLLLSRNGIAPMDDGDDLMSIRFSGSHTREYTP